MNVRGTGGGPFGVDRRSSIAGRAGEHPKADRKDSVRVVGERMGDVASHVGLIDALARAVESLDLLIDIGVGPPPELDSGQLAQLWQARRRVQAVLGEVTSS